ncbi:MAG: M48 family metalloprotease [Hyphomicrobiaceae bacterium]|nr:M48 family metalloprotease [Hyphomicrobiaceae bacterium]
MLPANGLYGHIRNNSLKSALLLAGFGVLIAAYWLAACLGWSALVAFFDPLVGSGTPAAASDAIFLEARRRALAAWHVPVIVTLGWFAVAGLFYGAMIRAATGARPLTRREAPALYATVERLAIAAGLPTPRIEIMETSAFNAYASGLAPSDATIAVTRGLLETLEPRELEAVVAHEMAHIKNRDVRLMVVALIFAGGITLVGELIAKLFQSRRANAWNAGSDFDTGDWSASGSHRSGGLGAGGVPALVGVVAALLVAAATLAIAHVGAIMTRMAISRTRELLADAGAVELTKNPDALISALSKISRRDVVAGATESMAAMMISNGFDEDDPVAALFATHPPVAARIEALSRYAGGLRLPPRQRRRLRPQVAPDRNTATGAST